MKICPKCKDDKQLSGFGKDKTRKDGLQNWCRICKTEAQRQYYKNNRVSILARNKKYDRTVKLSKRYGITLDQWNDMFKAQSGKCLICDKHQSEVSVRFAVDHCHKTGAVRGLLCMRCNARLAIVEDREFIIKAMEYLDNGSHSFRSSIL